MYIRNWNSRRPHGYWRYVRPVLNSTTLLTALATAALATTIDLENQCPAGQQTTGPCSALFSTAGNASVVNDLTAIGIVTIQGGTLFDAIANLPSDETVVYGTAGNAAGIGVSPGSGFINPLTITFPKPITGFFLDVLNGNTITVDYHLADNLGNSADFQLAPNFSGGKKTIGFAATGSVVTISAASGQNTPQGLTWDFLIDNISFTTQSTPEPASVWLIGVGLVLLGVARRAGKSRSRLLVLAAVVLPAAMLHGAAIDAAAPAPIALACPVNNGTVGVLYSSALVAKGGVPPYTFSVTKGALPAGLTLTAGTGAISGKPTAAGTAKFTAKVVDSLVVGAGGSPNSITADCSITIDKCDYTIAGPPDVPGLSQYTYEITLPAGKTAKGIKWTVDKSTASISGAADQVKALVAFQNSKADWVSLKASFTVDGASACAAKPVALVMVTVGANTFTNPGKASGSETGTRPFLVSPPAAPAKPTWVTTFTPGSDSAKFTYNGTSQAAEPRKFVNSKGGAADAFKAESKVTLTSPAEKNDAQQKIQVGFIQEGSDAGSAAYPGKLKRTVTTPTATTVDWLSMVSAKGATDDWPWYDETGRKTGTGTGTWTDTLSMTDSPGLSIPAEYNPNDAADANKNKAIDTANETFSFAIQMGARTLDNDLGADTHYFDQAHSTWKLDFVWPVAAPNVSIVTVGAAWKAPGAPAEISVNVIPTIKNHNSPFLRWNPGTCKPAVCP